jgi:hypothetical protein
MREELGVDAVLIPSVQLDDPAFPPRLALDLRLVSTGATPEILWQDAFAGSGVDRPGILGLSVIRTMAILRGEALNALADSLVAYLDRGVAPRPTCRAIRPRVAHRSASLDSGDRRTIALLPFTNQTRRRNAADAVALELARELLATGRFRLVEPGAVRSEMLARRVILSGGASLDAAELMGSALGAEVLIAGFVREYEDLPAAAGPPGIEVTVYAIDGRSGEVLWWSNSRSKGSDGVVFFGLGRVSTAAELACGVGRSVAELMAGDPRRSVARTSDPRAKAAPSAPDHASPDSVNP